MKVSDPKELMKHMTTLSVLGIIVSYTSDLVATKYFNLNEFAYTNSRKLLLIIFFTIITINL